MTPRPAIERAAVFRPLRTPVGAFGGALRSVPARIVDVVFAQNHTDGETPCTGR